jgi:hypothetical protein
MSSTLSYEASAGAERAIDSRHHGVRALYPMENGVAEDCIKILVIRQFFRIHEVHVKAEFLGRLDLRRAGVDCNYFATKINELLSKNSVSAAEV